MSIAVAGLGTRDSGLERALATYRLVIPSVARNLLLLFVDNRSLTAFGMTAIMATASRFPIPDSRFPAPTGAHA